MGGWVGIVPAALRGVTGYANLAAAAAANPGLQGLLGLYDAPYLCANDLQIDVAAQLIQNYTAFNPVTSRIDPDKTRTRRAFLSNLQGQTIAPKGAGDAPGGMQDNFAWVAAIRAAIAAFPD